MASSPADQALTLIAFRQARRRTFNERLAEIEFAPDAMLYRCECGLVACETAIKLTGLDYMGLRNNPRRFAVFAEHGVGVAKARFLELTRGTDEIAAMRAIKGALDPRGLLNPGAVLD